MAIPLSSRVKNEPIDLFDDVPKTELQEVFTLWQEAFEWSYYDEVMTGILITQSKSKTKPLVKSFQAIFCIDERECSLRRHIESVDPFCETLGTPGFFGVEFYFQPENAQFYDKLCPANAATPQYLIKEHSGQLVRKHELLYTSKTHTFFQGFLTSLTFGYAAIIKTVLNLFRPKMSQSPMLSFI